MRTCRFTTWLLLATVACAAVEVRADGYRCGRKLIRSGDTAKQLLRVCGEPLRKDRGREVITIDGSRQTVNVERWHYRQSRRRLEHIVKLHKGRVVAVDVGGS